MREETNKILKTITSKIELYLSGSAGEEQSEKEIKSLKKELKVSIGKIADDEEREKEFREAKEYIGDALSDAIRRRLEGLKSL